MKTLHDSRGLQIGYVDDSGKIFSVDAEVYTLLDKFRDSPKSPVSSHLGTFYLRKDKSERDLFVFLGQHGYYVETPLETKDVIQKQESGVAVMADTSTATFGGDGQPLPKQRALRQLEEDEPTRKKNTDEILKKLNGWLYKASAIEKQADNHDGIMIALFPSPEIAEKISMDGGKPSHVLHITLVYLGKSDEFSDEQKTKIQQIAQECVKHTPQIRIRLSGTNRFESGDAEQKDAFCALVDSEEVRLLRTRIVTSLSTNDIPYHNDFSFTPHITLKYLDKNEETPTAQVAQEFEINNITFVDGNNCQSFSLNQEAK